MKIEGTHVVLRDEIQETDFEDFYRWHNLEEWQYFDEPDVPFHPSSRDEFENRRKRPKARNSTSHTWQIDTVWGEHIGWVNCYQFDERTRCTYVGIDLPEPETWGKDFGTEAVGLVLDYLFREMGLLTVKTKTWTGNARMRRVAEKVGFGKSAPIPHHAAFSVRGEPLEFVEYAMQRAGWFVHKNHITKMRV